MIKLGTVYHIQAIQNSLLKFIDPSIHKYMYPSMQLCMDQSSILPYIYHLSLRESINALIDGNRKNAL